MWFCQKIFKIITIGCCFFGTSVFAQANTPGTISSGEKISIRIAEQEDLSGTYAVSSDGTIQFPLIPEKISVAGLTYAECADILKNALEKSYFYKATVSVNHSDVADVTPEIPSPSIQNIPTASMLAGVIYVYGKVNNPGVITIPEGEVLTMSKVIIRCGGFAQFANSRKVKLVRKNSATGRTQTIIVNLHNVIEKGKLDDDVVVRDGDLVVIPEQFFNF